MITVKPSTDEKQVLSFIQGNGVRRRISEGTGTPADPVDVVRNPDNHFVIAYDGETPVGFIAFLKMADQAYGIHVVLRTMGIKTYRIIEMAVKWAFEDLKAKTLYAIYPESHIAIRLLAASMGFTADPEAEKLFQVPGQTEPFTFQRLDSTIS